MKDYDMEENYKWETRPYARCKKCLSMVRSSYPGEFAVCDCFKNTQGKDGFFIDQTPNYFRCGGKMGNIEWVDPDVEHPIKEDKDADKD